MSASHAERQPGVSIAFMILLGALMIGVLWLVLEILAWAAERW